MGEPKISLRVFLANLAILNRKVKILEHDLNVLYEVSQAQTKLISLLQKEIEEMEGESNDG